MVLRTPLFSDYNVWVAKRLLGFLIIRFYILYKLNSVIVTMAIGVCNREILRNFKRMLTHLETLVYLSQLYCKLMQQYSDFFASLFGKELMAFGYERVDKNGFYEAISNNPKIAEIFIETKTYQVMQFISGQFCFIEHGFIYPGRDLLLMLVFYKITLLAENHIDLFFPKIDSNVYQNKPRFLNLVRSQHLDFSISYQTYLGVV